MSATDLEADDEPVEEPAGVDEDERPSIDEDDMADLGPISDDLDDADPVGPVGTSDDDQDEDDDVQDDLDGAEGMVDSGRNWGDLYVKSVSTASGALVANFGDEGAEGVSEQALRDMDLDATFEEVMVDKAGRPENIPPEQWLLIGTVLVVGANLATETDLLENAIGNLGDGGGAFDFGDS